MWYKQKKQKRKIFNSSYNKHININKSKYRNGNTKKKKKRKKKHLYIFLPPPGYCTLFFCFVFFYIKNRIDECLQLVRGCCVCVLFLFFLIFLEGINSCFCFYIEYRKCGLIGRKVFFFLLLYFSFVFIC